MAYDIRIKGLRDPIRMEKSEAALELERDWTAYQFKEIPDKIVRVPSWTGKLSDIKSFHSIGEAASTKKHDDQDYRDELRRKRSLSAEERAKELGFFRLIYWGFKRTRHIPTEIEAKAFLLQKEFYENNPKRTLPNINIFKELVGGRDCHYSLVDIINNHERQDIFAAKFL